MYEKSAQLFKMVTTGPFAGKHDEPRTAKEWHRIYGYFVDAPPMMVRFVPVQQQGISEAQESALNSNRFETGGRLGD